jgi:hypothetical protein
MSNAFLLISFTDSYATSKKQQSFPAVSLSGAWQTTTSAPQRITRSLRCRVFLSLIIDKNKGLPFRQRRRHLLSGRGDNPLNSSPRYPHELPSLFLSQAVTITEPEGFELITMQLDPFKFA